MSTLIHLYRIPDVRYCIHKMQTDYLWLTDNFIDECDIKFGVEIDKMNKSHDLATSSVCGDLIKDTESFAETLFMQYAYLTGSIWASPNNDMLNEIYRNNSCHILIELCRRGVYTIYGLEPNISTNASTRSVHNFIVLQNDIIIDDFVVLLQTLFLRGVNVLAKQVKANKVVKEIIYAKENDSLIYTDNFESCLSLDNNYSPIIDRDFGMSGLFTNNRSDIQAIHEYEAVEKEIAKKYSLFYVEIWSQSYDCFRVEDVLLQLWLEFNGKHGWLNNVPFRKDVHIKTDANV